MITESMIQAVILIVIGYTLGVAGVTIGTRVKRSMEQDKSDGAVFDMIDSLEDAE